MTGVAKITNVSIPSIARGGDKVTLVVVFENVGDVNDAFWWSLDEYTSLSGETIEYGGGANIFNNRVEGYYTSGQIGTLQKVLVMPRKPMWQLRMYVGHYSDAAKTIQVTDDWKDITISRSDYAPLCPLCVTGLEKSWKDGIS